MSSPLERSENRGRETQNSDGFAEEQSNTEIQPDSIQSSSSQQWDAVTVTNAVNEDTREVEKANVNNSGDNNDGNMSDGLTRHGHTSVINRNDFANTYLDGNTDSNGINTLAMSMNDSLLSSLGSQQQPHVTSLIHTQSVLCHQLDQLTNDNMELAAKNKFLQEENMKLKHFQQYLTTQSLAQSAEFDALVSSRNTLSEKLIQLESRGVQSKSNERTSNIMAYFQQDNESLRKKVNILGKEKEELQLKVQELSRILDDSVKKQRHGELKQESRRFLSENGVAIQSANYNHEHTDGVASQLKKNLEEKAESIKMRVNTESKSSLPIANATTFNHHLASNASNGANITSKTHHIGTVGDPNTNFRFAMLAKASGIVTNNRNIAHHNMRPYSLPTSSKRQTKPVDLTSKALLEKKQQHKNEQKNQLSQFLHQSHAGMNLPGSNPHVMGSNMLPSNLNMGVKGRFTSVPTEGFHKHNNSIIGNLKKPSLKNVGVDLNNPAASLLAMSRGGHFYMPQNNPCQANLSEKKSSSNSSSLEKKQANGTMTSPPPDKAQADDGTTSASSKRTNSQSRKKRRGRPRRNKADGWPKRPLSAYNLFFRDQRKKLIEEAKEAAERNEYKDDETGQTFTIMPDGTRKRVLPQSNPQKRARRAAPHGVISFEELGRRISYEWKKADDNAKEKYRIEAAANLKHYHDALEVFLQNKNSTEKNAEAEDDGNENDEKESSTS